MDHNHATEMMRETIRAMGQAAQGPGLVQQTTTSSPGPGLGSCPTPAPGPGLVPSRDVLARARLLPANSHTVVAVPAFNPDDTNSALLTYIQASNLLTTYVLIVLC